MTLDFITQLRGYVEKLEEVKMRVFVGGLNSVDSLSLYALPGGNTIRNFYNGDKDKQLGYEFQVKTKEKQQLALFTLDEISKGLDTVIDIPSQNGSYEFRKITITSLPSFVGADESGFFYYRLEIQAELTIKGVEING